MCVSMEKEWPGIGSDTQEPVIQVQQNPDAPGYQGRQGCLHASQKHPWCQWEAEG